MKFKDFLEIILEVDEPKEDEEKEEKEDTSKEDEKTPEEETEENVEDEVEDAEDNFEPEGEEEESDQDKVQAEVDAKFEELGNKVVVNIKDLLDKKPDIIIQKFQKLGVDEAVKEYLEQRFIPELEDDKDKMFLSLNMDDFLPIVAQKISVEYLKTGEE